jgi:hypothetical protein
LSRDHPKLLNLIPRLLSARSPVLRLNSPTQFRKTCVSVFVNIYSIEASWLR